MISLRTLVLLPGLLAVACGRSPAPEGPRELARSGPEAFSLMRLPGEGGEAALYHADSLTPLDWNGPSSLPKIRRALGVDLDDQMVYVVDADGEVIGIDLLARRARPYLAKATRLIGTADGVVLGLDSARRPVRFANRDLTTFRAAVEGGDDVQLRRAPGSRMSAYAPDQGTLQFLGEEGEVQRFEVPAGQLAASWFGDIVAITTDSGIVLLQPGRDAAEFVRVRGTPINSAFSPSAHRLYIARARGDVVVLDRFSRGEIATIRLPGAARELRPDRSGRWLLARGETGDSVWVVDIVANRLIDAIAAPWAADLPLVVDGRTLLTRSGADVVAWDLTAPDPAPGPRLKGAAGDVFLALDWRPRSSRPTSNLALAEPAPEASPADTVPSELPQDSAATAPAPGSGEIYIQVTSSQNEGYAKALAKQLSEIGFRARVRNPETEGAGFRVLVGPYQSRDDAEADGRRLGRPYFVTTPSNPEP